MIRLKDVAKYAGVSEATASLVLNERPGVNTKTRKKVQRAIKKLRYYPNHFARGLAKRRTQTLGLVVTDIENPFFGSMTKHINAFTRENSYDLVFSITDDDLETEDRILEDFIGKRLNGIIIIPTVHKRREFSHFERLRELGIPYIFSTTYYSGYECDYVMSDLARGSYELTKYLLELGHRDIILFASEDMRVPPSRLRINGYRKALEEFGVEFSKDRIIGCEHPDYYHGYKHMVQRIVSGNVPHAVTAINDVLALGAKQALIDHGIRVPADVSVAGYDDVVFSALSDIPLTTVKQNIPSICRTTVEMLLRKIKQEQIPRVKKKIATELILRKSTSLKT
jgi:LacI family transcriptional regulator